jgi:hypothetical protein
MNRKSLWIVLAALGLCVTFVTGCGSSSSVISVSISQAPPGILTPGATAQITATITGTSTGVTWSCAPGSGNTNSDCGSFNPSTTATQVATTYTAPATAVGSVIITATSVKNSAVTASVNVTISTSGGLAGNYAFYVSGEDSNDAVYSLAGAVTISANGTLTGEQDYNDADGLTSPSGGDMITGGNLSFDPTAGLGNLTLITNNTHLGVNGTETFALNFVNNDHALIIQADASATSSGSFDLQTLPSTPAGGFSFAVSGAGNTGHTHFFGGVFSVSGTSVSSGVFDENNNGDVSSNNPFTGTLSGADSFGRGTLTGTGIAGTIVYYIVGPEAIRLIDVDSSSTFVGSAFGQGASAGTFSTASIGTSVLAIQSNLTGIPYGVVGQIVPSAAAFSGTVDINEAGVGFENAQSISGTFTLGTNGYGSLTISPTLGPVSLLGLYATDPTLNLNDPNNTTTGGGGALIVDLDTDIAGSGVLVPQTDASTTSFAGNYALGFQDFVPEVGGEFDFVGNAAATAGSFSGAGIVNDPGDVLGTTDPLINTATTFSSTLVPDTSNTAGRYLLDPLNFIFGDGAAPVSFLGVIYQASGGQLFWMENGADGLGSVFTGQIQQQTLPLGAAAKKASAKQIQKP